MLLLLKEYAHDDIHFEIGVVSLSRKLIREIVKSYLEPI
jgi:hypothetical protein